MKNKIIVVLCLIGGSIGRTQPYNSIPIWHDTAWQWSAVSTKVVNLSSPEISLKKWYLEKIKNGTATGYHVEGVNSISSYPFSMPSLTKQDWLIGLVPETSRIPSQKEWYYYDPSISSDSYDRYKYRIGANRFSSDSCCGCDEADAFSIRQILNYRNGKFNIYNVYISPLCARRTGTAPGEWYPLGNVAYNNKADRKLPAPGKELVLLNTDVVDYEFNRQYPSSFDSVLTPFQSDIGSLIYQDILKGKLKAISPETGTLIPTEELLYRNMASDTMTVMDDDDHYKVASYKVMQTLRSPAEFCRLRIIQDLWFDFKNERMYSIVKSVTIMLAIRNYDGTLRGYVPFCRLE